jgi:hypothetical protein
MGWNDHVDWMLLDRREEMIAYGLLDEEAEDDVELIRLIDIIAYEGTLTPEEEAFYNARMPKLEAALEEEQEAAEFERLLSKDD